MTYQKWKIFLSTSLLCVVNLINYVDRYTLSGVLSDIKKEFDLNNQEGGLLQTSFIICYMISAPIFGYLGDRISRKWCMILGILFWSSATLTASFMTSYLGFLLFRALIGFGESGFTSLAPTVLGDIYTPKKRTIVLAIFYFAIPVGSGLGYILGDGIQQLTGNWRWGLRVTPLFNGGILLLMSAFLLDPRRGASEESSTDFISSSKNSLGSDLLYLLSNKSFVLTTLAFTALAFSIGALAWWAPEFIKLGVALQRESGIHETLSISEDDVPLYFGMIICISGIGGLILGSGLSYTLRSRVPNIDPLICGVGLLVSGPLLLGSLFICTHSISLTFLLIFLSQICLNMNWAIVIDICLYVTIPTVRSLAEALQLFASHALGEAGSPYIIGILSDSLKPHFLSMPSMSSNSPGRNQSMTNIEAEYYSLQGALYVTVALIFLSGILFLISALYILKDKERAEKNIRN